LTLGGTNTYTGGTTIGSSTKTGGTLKLAPGGSLFKGGDLTFDNIGNFDINGNTQEIGKLKGTGGQNTEIRLGSGGVIKIQEGQYHGVIKGDGSLVKDSNHTANGGTLTLSGPNSYTGTTTIQAGTLALDN